MKVGRTPNRSKGRGRYSPKAVSRQGSSRFSTPIHPLLQLQQTIGNQAVGRLIQAKLKVSQPDDKSEEEADRMADTVIQSVPDPSLGLLSVEPRVHRLPSNKGPTAAPTPVEAKTTAESIPAKNAGPDLIVEDAVEELAPGQMRKSKFLAEVRIAACQAADTVLAPTGRSTNDCPYLAFIFPFLSRRNSHYLEQTLRRFSPALLGATSTRAYIPFIVARVRQSTAHWVRTGEISGLPKGIPTAFMGIGGPPKSGAVSPQAEVIQFKNKAASTQVGTSPQTIRAQLGSARPLDTEVNSRMGSAFGVDFSHVRAHTDATAAELSKSLNARAFTVGEHIAFGSGEYQPGTPIGDALIAHELAHTVQQGAVRPSSEVMAKGESESGPLEEEADVSAVGAVLNLWGGAKSGLAKIGRNAMPRLRSGLKLQRCESKKEKETKRLANLQKTFIEGKAKEKERKRLEEERQKKIEDLKKAGVKSPSVPPVTDSDVEKNLDDAMKGVMDDAIKKATDPDKPTKRWDDIAKDPKKKADYIAKADTAIANVISKANSDPGYADIADLLKKTRPKFSAETAIIGLKQGWYGWASGSKFMVSMSWIDDAATDPLKVFHNIGHEIGGHIAYGEARSREISDVVLGNLDPKIRKELTSTPEKRQDYSDTYLYQETEIFSELRERKYFQKFKDKGLRGDNPDTNVPKLLQQIKENWHPNVAKVILTEVIKKARANPQIRKEDVDFLLEQIKKLKMGFEIK